MRVLCILVPFAALSIAWAAPLDIHSLAHAVDTHYDHLRSLEANFTEIYSGAGIDRTESGTLWLKKPGKMRWEYRSPREKLFLTDGKDAWFYVPGEPQARTISMNKLNDLRSPLAFLLGKTKLEKELQGLSLAPDVKPLQPGDIVLRGVPKVMAEQVSEVLLEITPAHWIDRILVEQVDGSSTEYRFTDQKENVDVADRLFHFTPPQGVGIVEGEFGQ